RLRSEDAIDGAEGPGWGRAPPSPGAVSPSAPGGSFSPGRPSAPAEPGEGAGVAAGGGARGWTEGTASGRPLGTFVRSASRRRTSGPLVLSADGGPTLMRSFAWGAGVGATGGRAGGGVGGGAGSRRLNTAGGGRKTFWDTWGRSGASVGRASRRANISGR